MKTENTDQKNIVELDALSKELMTILKAETQAMKGRNLEALASLGFEKNTLLNRLQDCNGFLSELFSQSPKTQEVESLKQLLHECHSINKENRIIATVELTHTNSSIELLRSLLQLDDVPLYGSYGEVTVSREKRSLGVV